MSCVVFLAAHADDVELAAGGTCALMCAKGYDVRIIIATDEAEPSIAGRRRREAIAGATALGVDPKHVHFLGFSDGYVTCNRETVTAVRKLVASFGAKPLAVFTHTQSDSHQDHIETSRIARAAFRQVSIFKFLVRNSAVPSGFAPSVHCMVDDYIAAKEAALAAHASQDHANRICLDKVHAFARKFARGKGAEFCEPFELEIQNDAPDVADLIATLDGAPFSRFWSPVMSCGQLTVLAGRHNSRVLDPSGMSELTYLTGLQGRLLSTLHCKLGDQPFARLDIRHGMGPGDEAFAERGHVLVLGCPDENPAAERLFDWIGLTEDGLHFRRASRSPRFFETGRLTIAANPFARRKGKRAFLFGATGPDQASAMAAAMTLYDDAKIAGIIDRANDVFAGRTPAAHIEVPTSQPGRANAKPPVAARPVKRLQLVSG